MVSVAVSGCGGEGDDLDDEGAQPAPGVSTFEQGEFDDLPLPVDAEPVGQCSEQDGIVTRSYEVQGMLPRDVLEFYERTLQEQGWSVVSVDEQPNGYRADWTTEEWNLRVSATDAPALGDEVGAEPVTQISLVLSPLSASTVPGGTDG